MSQRQSDCLLKCAAHTMQNEIGISKQKTAKKQRQHRTEPEYIESRLKVWI